MKENNLMKIKLLVTFILTLAIFGGASLITRATYDNMANFSEDIYYNAPTINFGKGTRGGMQPYENQPTNFNAEIYSDSNSVSLFSNKTNNRTDGSLDISTQTYRAAEQIQTNNVSNGNMNSMLIFDKSSSLDDGASSQVSTINSAKGSQVYSHLSEELSGTSPADDDDEEEIFYVSTSEGLWILILFLGVYLVWKIKKNNKNDAIKIF